VNLRSFVVALAIAVSPATFAQEAAPRGELGVRYWLSTGETKHSHNAQVLFPSAGNPTSVLTYENLDAHVFEAHARARFGGNWFLKGNAGLGVVNTGSFDDEDYFAGQVKFLDTTSSVKEGRISYFTLDVGRYEWSLQGGRTTFGAFVGFNQWTEDLDAYGINTTVDLSPPVVNEPDSLLVISNKARWRSLRLGLAADLALATKTRLGIDVAFIPYAQLRNEDSHHLRTDPSDLGPVPNIIHEGKGRGVQFDAELRHTFYRRTELGVGFRYWYVKATDGERKVRDFPDLPLVEFYSKRAGLTVSLTHNW
jgi:outer membrane protease